LRRALELFLEARALAPAARWRRGDPRAVARGAREAPRRTLPASV